MAAAPILLLSDLHLPLQASPFRVAFCRFLDGPARAASRVYILGDLFDFWIGDDAGLRDYATECGKLAALTASGVPVFFQCGNRDFLVGRRFAEATGAQLLPEYQIVNLPLGRTLLTHGDALCVDDVAFQRFRRLTKLRWLQRLFVALPAWLRWRITKRVQNANTDAKSGKPTTIMDVNQDAVRATMRTHGVTHMIHGHTHRPGRYALDDADQSLDRVVLADWRPDHMEYLACDSAGLHRLPL